MTEKKKTAKKHEKAHKPAKHAKDRMHEKRHAKPDKRGEHAGKHGKHAKHAKSGKQEKAKSAHDKKHEKHAKHAKAHKPAKKPQAKDAKPEAAAAKQALILSFRRGRHTQRTNQFLLGIRGADTRAKASQYIGSRVVWTSPGKLKKQIHGKITKTHGNNGVLRARFSRGLPGTAVGTRVELLEK